MGILLSESTTGSLKVEVSSMNTGRNLPVVMNSELELKTEHYMIWLLNIHVSICLSLWTLSNYEYHVIFVCFFSDEIRTGTEEWTLYDLDRNTELYWTCWLLLKNEHWIIWIELMNSPEHVDFCRIMNTMISELNYWILLNVLTFVCMNS